MKIAPKLMIDRAKGEIIGQKVQIMIGHKAIMIGPTLEVVPHYFLRSRSYDTRKCSMLSLGSQLLC